MTKNHPQPSTTSPHSLSMGYCTEVFLRAHESSLMSDHTGELTRELDRILKLESPTKERELVRFLVRSSGCTITKRLESQPA